MIVEVCNCINGVIECPACKDSSKRDRVKYICAGCLQQGFVTCGKCGGKNKVS